jgi:manganese-dependent inorganic pyrophosphatase
MKSPEKTETAVSCPHYVCGHRNPDTDAIVSAHALAWLHQQRYPNSNALAIRIGEANRQTEWLFRSCGIALPPLRSSCLSRADEILSRAPRVDPDTPLREALEGIQRTHAACAVVCDANDQPLGIISDRHPRTNYLLQCNVEDFFGTLLDFRHVVRGLPLKTLSTKAIPAADRLEVVLHKHTFAGNWEQHSVLVIGDRDLLLETLILRPPAAVIVVGVNHERALEIAAQLPCPSFLFSGSVVNLCARLPGCVPCSAAMEPDFCSVPANADLATLEKIARAHPLGVVVVDAQQRMLGTLSADNLLAAPRPRLSLVDHSERRQSIDGLDRAEIIEIVDHHRLGDIETYTPISIDVRPVGSTATIINARIQAARLPMPEQLARLLLGALVSDTLLLTSPTTTPTDRQTAKDLATTAKIDLNSFGLEVLRQNDELTSAPATQLVARDCKDFYHGNSAFLLAQIETVDLSVLTPQITEALRAELLHRVHAAQAAFGLVMVTDVINTRSQLILAADSPDWPSILFNGISADQTEKWLVEGMVSRKKQLLPWVFAMLDKHKDT